MIKIRDIEKAVSNLPKRDLAEFRKWFYQFEALRWDKQFERDVKDGKLNNLAQKAKEGFDKR